MERHAANSRFRSATTFVGPLGGPIMSGFLSTKLGWRSVFWRVSPFH
jgi:MFS family permease